MFHEEGDDKVVLREEVEEVIRNAYRAGWLESNRWPNHPQPPEVEVLWGYQDGIRIQEDHTKRMS